MHLSALYYLNGIRTVFCVQKCKSCDQSLTDGAQQKSPSSISLDGSIVQEIFYRNAYIAQIVVKNSLASFRCVDFYTILDGFLANHFLIGICIVAKSKYWLHCLNIIARHILRPGQFDRL